MHVMHGGPHTMSRNTWHYRWNPHAFAAPGYIVACVNRHGSTGFGEKFAQSILNEWGEKPFEDIMKSTDFLLAKLPNIDSKRMAATGASYGGYMAAWVLGHTDRFAAIINHAGVNNAYSQFACDIPHGFAKVMGGTPWENVEGMQRNNPMFYAKNFKTPTLDHARRARLPRALRQRSGALRRASSDERAVAPGGLSEREPLGAFAAELDLLVLRVPKLARALPWHARAEAAEFRPR